MMENEPTNSVVSADRFRRFREGFRVGGVGGILAAVALVVAAHRLGALSSSSARYWTLGAGCVVWALWEGYVFQKNVPKALGMIAAWLLISIVAAAILGIPVGLTCLGASAYYIFDSWNWTGSDSKESA